MTQDPGYPRARPTRYLMRSLLRNHKAAAWAWQSACRSSNRMAAGSGPTATAGVARRSTSPYRRLLRAEANRYAVSIRIDLATDVPIIKADRVQLQQVLMNIMLNGIEDRSDEGDKRSNSISDTGIGLPAEKAD